MEPQEHISEGDSPIFVERKSGQSPTYAGRPATAAKVGRKSNWKRRKAQLLPGITLALEGHSGDSIARQFELPGRTVTGWLKQAPILVERKSGQSATRFLSANSATKPYFVAWQSRLRFRQAARPLTPLLYERRARETAQNSRLFRFQVQTLQAAALESRPGTMYSWSAVPRRLKAGLQRGEGNCTK